MSGRARLSPADLLDLATAALWLAVGIALVAEAVIR